MECIACNIDRCGYLLGVVIQTSFFSCFEVVSFTQTCYNMTPQVLKEEEKTKHYEIIKIKKKYRTCRTTKDNFKTVKTKVKKNHIKKCTFLLECHS